MTNREKYKDELIKVCGAGSLEHFFNKHIKPFYDIDQWIAMSHANVAVLITLWLDEEYIEPEPEVDWSKVAVDTPILVRDKEKGKWHKRYFAKFKNGVVSAWYNGATSWSEDGKSSREWRQAKLAEDENGSNE